MNRFMILVWSVFILLSSISAEVLLYDDGTSEEEAYPGMATWEFAEWFTPLAYPCTLVTVMFYPYNTIQLHWKVWDDDGLDPGPPQDPGTLLSSGFTTPSLTYNWLTIDLPTPVIIPDGDFYIGWEEHIPAYWNGFDTTPPHANRACFHWDLLGEWVWSFLTDPLIGQEGDLMIRAVIGEGLQILEPGNKPDKFELIAYPSPFNSLVNIWIQSRLLSGQESSLPAEALAKAGNLGFEIYDINGRLVYSFGSGSGEPITNLSWRPDNSITAGLYLLKVNLGVTSLTQKVLYLK